MKIHKMCSIMGIDLVYDPDSTYELTADNVKKMLAIYMRFRFTTVSSLFVLYARSQFVFEHLNSAVGKAVANHAKVRGSLPSTYVGKEPDREKFAPVPDAFL